ncbi:hypothetical protein [Roseibium sp. RKSG952]|uniref:hypothetical protein n=1 Tax=Roseibium sp. RKSG952 TaxID=2529384 RepID=UPI0012BC564C|nr:hypothetical protein [Roseibium sp. RKSG952]MTH94845.1 hypothetical protein [Roseibium sp. RKSG952]
MSRHEFERGEITIPSAEWVRFKQKLREASNRTAVRRLELATKLYNYLKSSKAKPSEAREVARVFLERENTGSAYSGYKYTDNDLFEAQEAVIKGGYGKVRPKISKPLKKDFPLAGNNAERLIEGEVTVHFDNKNRRVSWYVAENNHACERARNSILGKAFFAALKSVKWTRNSGGTIYGNDEYNREADYPGGGGHYTKERFGSDDVPFSRRL